MGVEALFIQWIRIVNIPGICNVQKSNPPGMFPVFPGVIQMSVDEKKPPEGGVLDVNRLAAQYRVVRQLLAAREELRGAEGSCVVRRDYRFPAAAEAIRRFVESDLQRLIAEVVPLLEQDQPGSQP